MTTLVFANQKGGVGKTTSALNIGAYLAHAGKKVLLIDLDPQANLTSGVGFFENLPVDKTPETSQEQEPSQPIQSYPSIYDVLIGDKSLSQVFTLTEIPNLMIVPSHISLAGAEVEMVNLIARESLLKKALENFQEDFDYVIIDCPPSLGLLTINALNAADYVIVPIQCEYYALEGLSQLTNTIDLVKNINPNLQLGGIVMTMFDSRTKLSAQVVDEVRKHFGQTVFDTVIPRNVRLSEAPSHGKTILQYDKNSSGGVAYEKLAKEFIQRFDSRKRGNAN